MNVGDRRVNAAFAVGLTVGLLLALAVGGVFYLDGVNNGRLIGSASPPPRLTPQPSPSITPTPLPRAGTSCNTASAPSLSRSSPTPTPSQEIPQSPGARSYAAMAFDPDRHQLVLFGGLGDGYLGDTWEWIGTSWTKLWPAHSPAARQKASLVWDSARHLMVLFGGYAVDGVALNDTWTWNGTDWSPIHTTHCPAPRAPMAMAYDEAAAKVVVFGARLSSANVADTWLWDGKDWSQLPNPEPGANVSFQPSIGMAWDPAAKSVTLIDFQSRSAAGVNYWRLGKQGWGSIHSVGPTGYIGFDHLVAFDPGRNLWLSYGPGMESHEMIIFDGASLASVRPFTVPSGEGSSMAETYDPDLKEIVTFGGLSLQGPTAELWGWDFMQWSRLSR